MRSFARFRRQIDLRRCRCDRADARTATSGGSDREGGVVLAYAELVGNVTGSTRRREVALSTCWDASVALGASEVVATIHMDSVPPVPWTRTAG